MILWWAGFALFGVVTAVWAGGSALASWREQRAGLVYELTPRYRGAALRGAAAVAAVGCVCASGVAVGLSPQQQRAGAHAEPPPARSARASAAPTRTSPAHTSPGLLTVGHPSGGQLLEGTLPGVPGRLRVWLPKQYLGRTAPLQVLLVRADAAELGSVLDGLQSAAELGRANPFVAVVPIARCDPAAYPPAAALRRALAARFHVRKDAQGWALLGLGAGAPCAVAAELAHPADFTAAAGLSGHYEALVPLRAPNTGAPGTAHLLLADAFSDTAGQQSAARLRTALATRPRTDLRTVATAQDFSPERQRFRLVRQGAGYLTELLAGPAAAQSSPAQSPARPSVPPPAQPSARASGQ
ncbi:hypothetical protein [Streptacidiphilus carbonis]|jgi:hypothetical protein|uniref:hypothetical protein n=1 Tax=Streptacidiphilus carbonis TaxID=105422 RepID=UPI0005A5DF86|nr:hypothetical protein [Streptacidiphilus carbonis]